ncbi:MAG: DUF1648 domain-containing protein [Bacteroidetes bacterium]|nr:MAG: DUF1648 domain-containing protein [Bacteroidota bacterium]
MRNSGPQIPLLEQERMIEWFALFLLIAMWLFVLMKFGALPETIPHHFNAKGEPDSWGGKAIIFLAPGIALGTYLLFYFISKMSPDSYNYPVKITEENKEFQYAISRIMLKVMNLWTMILMAYITWAIIAEAGGLQGSFNSWILWTLILGIFVITAGFLVLARKYK